MQAIPVAAILDIGKTNKKILLFDETYSMVYEHTERMEETVDEDGFPCEDLMALRDSVIEMMGQVFQMDQYEVKAINFTTYGASFVYLDDAGNPLTHLYNYLKPYPEALQHALYSDNGGEKEFLRVTSSPSLGSLNSGLQVLRLKKEQPAIFDQVAHALHLPQYISYLFTGAINSDITSVGCHTQLWDFTRMDYHKWVDREGLTSVLAPMEKSDHANRIQWGNHELWAGIGLHDSSSALIPYLVSFKEPFILISTGTWSISLNPFDGIPLTDEELQHDCLCYLQYTGKPVKAARYFLGPAHENGVAIIASHYALPIDFYTVMQFDANTYEKSQALLGIINASSFGEIDLMTVDSPDLAYYLLMHFLVQNQIASTRLLMQHQSTKRILVDGGFSKNAIFMQLMAKVFGDIPVFASEVPQATAMGAALALHSYWNNKQLPSEIIALKAYPSGLN
jgi:sugar (pentulose or hexulose) kinase